MARVYQRLLALAAVLYWIPATGCGRSEPLETAPTPGAETSADGIAFELFFVTASHRLPAVGGTSPTAATTRESSSRSSVIALSSSDGEPHRALTPASVDCRAVAPAPVGRLAVVECRDPATGAPSLRLVDTRSDAPLPPRPLGGEGEAFLAWSPEGEIVWTATASAAGTPARLMATTTNGARRAHLVAPAEFAITTYSPTSDRTVFHRALHDEAHEVVLRDGATGTSRLLLPTGHDGRFTALQFVDDGRALLLLADDGTDQPRLERLDLSHGERVAFGALPCPPVGVRAHGDASATVVVDCGGRLRAVHLDAAGREIPLPPVAEGTRIVDWLPATAGAVVVETVGERWPREIGIVEGGDYRPVTYGLSGRLRPSRVPPARPWKWSADGIELDGEVWSATGLPADATVVWIGDAESPSPFGELRPLLAALASHGVTTVRARGRGDQVPSRRVRRGADGDPAASAWRDLRALAAAAKTSLPATSGAPTLLVGEGPWWGAAAVALAATGGSPFDVTFALFPSLDPLAPALESKDAPEPRRSRLVARWGEIDEALLRRRDEWRLPVEAVRQSTWVALDARTREANEVAARIAAAAAAGAPVEAFVGERGKCCGRLAAALERELARRILDTASGRRR